MVTAIYARVSTKDGRQTAENQLGVLRTKALEFSDEVQEFVDHASGSKSDRESLTLLMSKVEKGEVKTLLIWALDRLTREGISAMTGYLEVCKSNGVRVLSIQEPWLDTEGPVSELLVAIFAWVARQERLRIKDRIIVGLNRARAEGKVLGRPPIHKTRRVLNLRNRGKTMREIATITGIPKSSVCGIIKTNSYMISGRES